MKHINKASHVHQRIKKDSLNLVEDNFLPCSISKVVFFVTTVSDVNIQTMNCPPVVSFEESEMAIPSSVQGSVDFNTVNPT